MIKLFLSVTLATAFMGLVACEPTSTSTTVTVAATPTPTTATESTDTVRETDEATQTSTSVKATATQPPTTITESTDTVAEAPEAGDTPVVTTESTGNVTGEGNGTVTDYTPGEALTVKTDSGESLRCKFGEIVTYVTSDGKVIDASKVRRDSKVRVLYHKDGDDVVVDKVIVSGVRD